MGLIFKYHSFDELSAIDLYAILQLRSEVFVVEQKCVYLDADGKDQASFHISGWDNEKLVAYCRVLIPGASFIEASIGRVATATDYRGKGYGRTLMERSIAFSFNKFNCHKITISAQLYLLKFYQSLGFAAIGQSYFEDGIPHIEMQLTS